MDAGSEAADLMVALDIHAQLVQNLGVLDEADILIGKVGVVAVGLNSTLIGVLGGILLQQIQILIAIGLGQAAEDHVCLGILLLSINTSHQFAQRAADELHVHIGVLLVEDLQEHFVIHVSLSGVDHHGAGQRGGIIAIVCVRLLGLAAGHQGQGHDQGKKQAQKLFHVLSPFCCLVLYRHCIIAAQIRGTGTAPYIWISRPRLMRI